MYDDPLDDLYLTKEQRRRIRWQRIKKLLEIIAVTLFLVGLLVLIVFIILGYRYNWAWAGLGPNAPSFQRGRTLWDWLQLLIIPLVLAVGGYGFNLTVSRNEQKSTKLRDQTERDIAGDNQQEAALQTYIDKMSELLLEKKLRESQPEDEVQKIARVRTLTVLPRLDKDRKKSVLQFLYESGLINKDKSIIDLRGANLHGANLSNADLHGANLDGVNLSEADLIRANLSGSNLRDANLSGADGGYRSIFANIIIDLSGVNRDENYLDGVNLSEADLSGATLYKMTIDDVLLEEANSLKGATMPDGSKHS